jgi:predicted small metal-binding protein
MNCWQMGEWVIHSFLFSLAHEQVLTEEILAKTYLPPANLGLAAMASMVSCDCGWTLVSPAGDADVKKHAKMHASDAHPGMTITDEQLTGMIKRI